MALDAPEAVHSLILLEPALIDVPSGALLGEVFGPVLEQYGAGDKEGAADSFIRWAIGPDYRSWLDRMIPGAYEQLVADADTFFGVELPSLQEWHFTREDARRITQPVLGVLGSESASIWPGWNEVQERLREWLPQTEPFVLAGSNHALEEKDPRGVAEAMVPFLARHRNARARLSPSADTRRGRHGADTNMYRGNRAEYCHRIYWRGLDTLFIERPGCGRHDRFFQADGGR